MPHSRLLTLALSTVLLSACNTTPTQPNSSTTVRVSPSDILPEGSPASLYYAKGNELYERWAASDEDLGFTLMLASMQLSNAVAQQPDNVLYQLTDYNAYASLMSSQDEYDEGAVLERFNTLHPIVQTEAITPAFISFSRARYAEAPLSELIEHMLRATEQNPFNPQNWYFLAELYGEAEMRWLAIGAADVAHTLLPDHGAYSYEKGWNFYELALDNACRSQQRALLTRASSLFAEAALKDQQNGYFFAHSSDTYLRLGLVPLAAAQAQRAVALERSPTALSTQFGALFYQSRFDEAWVVLKQLSPQEDSSVLHYQLMESWHALSQNYSVAAHQQLLSDMAAVDQHEGIHFYRVLQPLFARGLPALDQKSVELDQEDWEITEYLAGREKRQDFIELASSGCEKERRQFYLAVREELVSPAADGQHFREHHNKPNQERLLWEAYWSHLLSHTSGKLPGA